MTVLVSSAGDLGPEGLLRVADGAGVQLAPSLLEAVERSRALTLAALTSGLPVYGVSTGLGNQSHLAVGTEEQETFQDDLMLARSVGGAPWLGARQVRAVLATRLRTLLEPEAGVSPALLQALVAVLDAGLHPAVPATGNGAAGEIIPLAHLGAFLTGRGEGLDTGRGEGLDGPGSGPGCGPGSGPGSGSGRVRPAAELLAAAGLTSYRFGPKEGVAFLQGVPVATGLAVLLGDETRLLASQALVTAAAEVALVRAPRDPYVAALARGDAELAAVHARLLDLAGPENAPRVLQAPVSFRVTGPALAHLRRSLAGLDAAVTRGLLAVSTSPALVDGRFLGTAGFDGFDLAAAADGLRLAVVHVAEVATARLHRLLDPAVTGLPAQLSAAPGRQAGLVAVHKHAVGLVHELRRVAAPASLGATETSQGQEDVQGFALEALGAAGTAVRVLRQVTASELVLLHRAVLLDDDGPRGSGVMNSVLQQGFRRLPDHVDDRPTGPDVAVLTEVLRLGWCHDVLGKWDDARPAGR